MVAIKPVPTTTIRVKLRSHDHGNPGRRANGISHTELSAFCSEFATPSAPMNVPTRPIASATPVWFSLPMLARVRQTTGYASSSAFSTLAFSSGSFLSTMSSTVTRTSSSGKIATKAEYAISAARLPAWSSPNFFHTATGTASQACRCWSSSAVRMALLPCLVHRQEDVPGLSRIHPPEPVPRCRRPSRGYGLCATSKCYKFRATSSGCRQPWPAPAEADGLALGLGVVPADPDDPGDPDDA